MSIKVMTYIWEHSKHKGSGLLLLLAIGDHAHDDGTGAYPSVKTLAEKVRMSERSVHYLIKRLVASGELGVDSAAGPKGCNLFRVQMAEGVQTSVGGGANQRMQGVQPIAPEPSIEPSLNRHTPVVPDWAKPLTDLAGYKDGNHTKAIKVIEGACEYRGVEVATVVATFCDYWPIGRLKHSRWKAPFMALANTIEIQIDKVRQKEQSNGTTQVIPTERPFAKYGRSPQ